MTFQSVRVTDVAVTSKSISQITPVYKHSDRKGLGGDDNTTLCFYIWQFDNVRSMSSARQGKKDFKHTAHDIMPISQWSKKIF